MCLWLTRPVASLEEFSREELIALALRQAALVDRLTAQVAAMAVQVSELVEANEDLAGRLARAEHLLSRNSGNSSMPPSGDDAPGRTPPVPKRRGGTGRKRGGQPGSSGSKLEFTADPDEILPLFPQGACGCGADLSGAADLGVFASSQQTEIPMVIAKVTQYDRHAARCLCGKVHVAPRPAGTGRGQTGYGPNLRAWCVYLLAVQFLPVQRVCRLMRDLTGAEPSPGFVHGILNHAAAALREADRRIRALITLAYAVCLDETPLRVGPAKPKAGKKRAQKYLIVACTELYTHFLLGDRDLATFKATVLAERTDRIIVHDRYQNYDSAEIGPFLHQLCCQHLLRDLDGAAECYPDQTWPGQIARALRTLIHEANQARHAGRSGIDPEIRDRQIFWLRHGVLLGLGEMTHRSGNRPGEAKARGLIEVLHQREHDVLRFAYDLRIPPTSNQAERDLRPSKIQQKISGRLTSEKTTADRYTIRGVLSTAAKHGANQMTILRDTLTGIPWLPPEPAT
jgi:transposase